jgi:uncharacterized protein (TIGR02231 family)
MKKSLWVVLLVLVLSGSAHAEAFKRVVLFQDMAYLTALRTAANGKIVVDAPPEMIRDSLSVVPVQGGLVRAIGIEPKRLMSGRAAALKDDLAKSRGALEGKKRLRATAEREIDLIFESAKGRDKEASFSKPRLTEALTFIDARVGSLNEKIVSLDREIEDLTVKVKDLEAELSQVSAKQGYQITVETDSERVFQVSYAVTNSLWTPEYTVYADPAAGELIVETGALMRQSTGTDWEIGELSVATGRPGFGVQAPELFPWEIGLPRPYLNGGVMRKAEMAPMAMAEVDMAAPAPEPEVKATAATFLVGAAKSVTLTGDGKPRTVVLQKKKLKASLERVAAPKLDSAVYLRASSLWEGKMPLMAGSYTAFVEGEFMGRGYLKQAQPGEKISVDLGKDEGIKVERKEKIFHDRTFTGKDRTACTYTMTLKNTRQFPVRVTLKDQIPISRDESVKVDLIETSPKATPDKDGIVSWDFDVKPGAEDKAVLSFSVTGMLMQP